MPVDRYEGKPMLRLLECYTLHALGLLDHASEANLVAMTPKLRTLYSAEGEWHNVIEKVMQLPTNTPELIRELWIKNQKIAKDNDVVLSPQEFAEMFVDANLV
jgi:hypothetical protein